MFRDGSDVVEEDDGGCGLKTPRVATVRVITSVLFLCAALAAQVMTPVAPTKLKVEFENEQLRVSRVKLAPGESLENRKWLPHVRVSLSSNELTVSCKDHPPENSNVKIGDLGWSDAAECRLTNGANPFEIILIEFKNAKEPARALATPPIPHPTNFLDESYHHWALENQYVRVYDVRIPQGATSGFHTHALDTIFIEISGGNESAQSRGGEWQPGNRTPGEVAFSGDSKKTRVHRVRNDSKGEYHVIAVQALQ